MQSKWGLKGKRPEKVDKQRRKVIKLLGARSGDGPRQHQVNYTLSPVKAFDRLVDYKVKLLQLGMFAKNFGE